MKSFGLMFISGDIKSWFPIDKVGSTFSSPRIEVLTPTDILTPCKGLPFVLSNNLPEILKVSKVGVWLLSLDFNICISADILPISCEGSTPASSNLCSSLSLLDFLLFALLPRLRLLILQSLLQFVGS